MSDDWLIDKFRLHHLDKPFFHGGVKPNTYKDSNYN